MNEKSVRLERRCPLCGGDFYCLTPYGNEIWPVANCRLCGFAYLPFVPDSSHLADVLAWERTSAAETLRKRQKHPFSKEISNRYQRLRKNFFKRHKLKRLLKLYVNGGHLLDVGCAGGNFLADLPESFIPYGIEVSQKLAEKAANKMEKRQGRIFQGLAVSCMIEMSAGALDCIIMSAFLEHESQPQELLSEAYRILKPGGLVIIKVPNYASILRRLQKMDWCGFRLPDHVNYFTPKTLRIMCEMNKFKVKKFNVFDYFPFSDNMWMVLEK